MAEIPDASDEYFDIIDESGNIIGKAWLVIWPLGDWGGAPNQSPELVPAS